MRRPRGRWLVVLLLAAGALRAAAESPEGPGAAPAAAADAPELPVVEGDHETTITALRLPRPRRDVPAAVSILPREEIARSPALTADAIARTLPSAATFRRSSSLVADPSSQSLNLRGAGPSGASRALVLLDGVPLNDPFGGWVYWRSLSPLDLERLEVTPSGASALYGNFALGGVAQFVSRPFDARSLEALASAGGGLLDGAARATWSGGPVAAELSGSGADVHAWTPVAPGQRGAVDHRASSAHANARARLRVRPSPALELTGHARFFHESLDTGTDFTSATARVLAGGAGARLRTGAGTVALDAFAGSQRFGQERARVSEDRGRAELAADQRVPSTSQGGAAIWTPPPLHAAGEHQLLLGADVLRVRGTSHERLHPASASASAPVARDAGGEQRFLGIFVQDGARLAPWLQVTAALRVDRWWNVDGTRAARSAGGALDRAAFDDQASTELSPRAGVLARRGPVALRVSAYRAFRAPTLNELYRPFQVGTVVTAANAALRAETLRGVEAGPELSAGPATLRVMGFWNVLERPIQNVTLEAPLPDGSTRQRRNLGSARIRGVEAEATWRPSRRLRALAAYTYVQPVVSEAPGQESLVGRDLPQDPRHRATASLGFADPRLLTATVQVRAAGRQFEDDLNTLPMGAFAVVDVFVERELGRGLALFAAAENLLDRRYLVGRAGVDTVGQPLTLRAGLHWRAAGTP